MKTIVLVMIALFSFLFIGCDNGQGYGTPPGVRVKVSIEREQIGTNPSLVIFAKGMQRIKGEDGDALVFFPPCYLGQNLWDGNGVSSDNNKFVPIARFEERDTFRITILPGSMTDIRVEDVNPLK